MNRNYFNAPAFEGVDSIQNMIIKIVCNEYNINPELIKIKNRSRILAEPRKVISKLLQDYCELTTKAISYKAGYSRVGKPGDHSSVITGINVVNGLIKYNKTFEKFYNNIERRIIPLLTIRHKVRDLHSTDSNPCTIKKFIRLRPSEKIKYMNDLNRIR